MFAFRLRIRFKHKPLPTSLDTVELVLALEDEFCLDIPEAEADKIQTVEDAVSYLVTNPAAKYTPRRSLSLSLSLLMETGKTMGRATPPR